jgi:quercetin dioxygenase-like cupin family protein
VTAGEGLVCADGEGPQVIRAGDVVWTPPGERHWHGATADSIMSHTAISLGATEWAEEVSDSDYLSRIVTKDTL